MFHLSLLNSMKIKKMKVIKRKEVDFSKIEKIHEMNNPSYPDVLTKSQNILVFRNIYEVPPCFTSALMFLNIDERNFTSLTVRRGVSLKEDVIDFSSGKKYFFCTGNEEFKFEGIPGFYVPQRNTWTSFSSPVPMPPMKKSGREFFLARKKKGFLSKYVRSVPDKQIIIIIEIK